MIDSPINDRGGPKWFVYLSLWALVSLGALLAACQEQEQTLEEGGEPFQVEGQVTDLTGNPISGVTVAIASKDGSDERCEDYASDECSLITEETDASGEYLFNVEDRRAATFLVPADNLQDLECTESFFVEQEDVFISGDEDRDFELYPCEASISGVVKDRETADAIPGAIIIGTIPGTGEKVFESETDRDGEYSDELEIGSRLEKIRIEADAIGYESMVKKSNLGYDMNFEFILSEGKESPTIYTASKSGEVHMVSSDGGQEWIYDGYVGYVDTFSDQVFDTAVDQDGYVYTASGTNNDVRKLTPNGEKIWAYDASGYVQRVEVDADGFVYARTGTPGGGSSSLHKVTPDGEQLWVYPSGGGGAVDAWENDVAVDEEGYSYTGLGDDNDTELAKLSPGGELIWTYSKIPRHARGVAVDDDGFVFVASAESRVGDDAMVQKITPDGEQEWSYTGHSDDINEIVVDAHGSVYTASSDGDVYKLTPSGERDWSYDGHSAGVFGVAVDANGFVYTASRDNEVHKLTPGGERIWRYTGHSNDVYGVSVFPGSFSISQGLGD